MVIYFNGPMDGVKLFVFVLVALLSSQSRIKFIINGEIRIWFFLVLAPLFEVVLKAKTFSFGFARELDTDVLYFTSNTMELPLILLVLGITVINSSRRYKVQFLGSLLLLANVYAFNRRFVVIGIVLWILVNNLPRVGMILTKMYSVLLPMIWGFMSLVLVWLSAHNSVISSVLTKGEGTRNILTASGRIQGWIFGSKFLFENPIWFGSYGQLPRDWFYTESDRYHHVHNTLIQTGLDYGLVWSFLLLVVLLKLNINSGRKIVAVAMFPTESLFMNMHLVAVIILLIIFENEENKDTFSDYRVKT